MSSKRIVGLMLVLLVSVQASEEDTGGDYCNLYDCGTKHVACHTGERRGSCPEQARLVDIRMYKDLIVDLHNEYRNRVAAGVSGLRRAARMATMRWDDDLAYVARYSVLQCQMRTELCHNTRRFRHSGQNAMIHGIRDRKLKSSLKDIIELNIATWFNQSDVCTRAIIKKYRDSREDEHVFGHFTLAANERNTHVGCAASRYPKDGYQQLLFLCNYATNNIRGKPVYKTSERIGGKCHTGHNRRYPNLCSISERYDYDYNS